ncbi:hypothetical protein BZL30_7134 [Mycobacterium kansasii]|uniref:Uncharacterized protein n=1 Tax=Mycobacterium kansasii TaxID=1768 RepID=A0A1V3WRN4_MYCKA|nr:hypothetical protein BZL30_7134 [Mycobacterium kansasii]
MRSVCACMPASSAATEIRNVRDSSFLAISDYPPNRPWG